jgi:hypothetical protein
VKPHKDLPPGSQPWANEVDALMAEVKRLTEVVKRLTENAGLDFANPQRGVSAGPTPSIKNPVSQKLSSLADVASYNVLDGQYLSWSQQGQKWLPVTLPTPSAGGTIDISALSYSGLTEGYGTIADSTIFAYTAAGIVDNPFGPDYPYVETWTTDTAYYGAGNWDLGPVALIEMSKDGFERPYVQLSADDYTDGTYSDIVVASYLFTVNAPRMLPPRRTTATRPTGLVAGSNDLGSHLYDLTLKKPIWWDGAAWRDALGTAV